MTTFNKSSNLYSARQLLLSLPESLYKNDRYYVFRDLAETIESRPLCITDLFQNKSVAYLKFIKKIPSINFIFYFFLFYVTF